MINESSLELVASYKSTNDDQANQFNWGDFIGEIDSSFNELRIDGYFVDKDDEAIPSDELYTLFNDNEDVELSWDKRNQMLYTKIDGRRSQVFKYYPKELYDYNPASGRITKLNNSKDSSFLESNKSAKEYLSLIESKINNSAYNYAEMPGGKVYIPLNFETFINLGSSYLPPEAKWKELNKRKFWSVDVLGMKSNNDTQVYVIVVTKDEKYLVKVPSSGIRSSALLKYTDSSNKSIKDPNFSKLFPLETINKMIVDSYKQIIANRNFLEKYEVTDFTENPDGSYDIQSTASFQGLPYEQLPVKIRKSKDFYIQGSRYFNSLINCPDEVNGNFNVANNQIDSLDGLPSKVKGNVWVYGNARQFSEDEVRSVCKVSGKVFTQGVMS